MQRQEATQVLEALQSFASLLEKDGLYTEAHQKAFERTALLLSKEGFKGTPVELMPISQAAAYYLEFVFDAVSQADAYHDLPIEKARLCVDISDVYYLLGDWEVALARLTDAMTGAHADAPMMLAESRRLQQAAESPLGEARTRYEQAFDLFQRLNAENDEKRVKYIMEQLA